MTQQEIQMLINEQWNIVHDREAKLRSYDYIGTKIAMGVATTTDYADEIAETEQWRNNIRAAKAEITRLETLEPDTETEGAEDTAEE